MSKDILRDLRGFGTVEKWVLTDPKISISAKGLYALLCAFAGDKGHAFPGTELLSHQLNISKPTLQKVIKELKDHGVVHVEQVRRDGRFGHNVYSLLPKGCTPTVVKNFDNGKADDSNSDNSKTDDNKLNTNNNSLKKNSSKSNSNKPPIPPEGDSGDLPKTPKVEQKPKPPKPEKPKKEPKPDTYSEKFEQWWSVYPRKTAKGTAWNRWKKDKLESRAEDLIEKITQQVAMQYAFTETRYIPNASTYLNQKRYDDEIENKGVKNGIATNTNGNQRKESTMDRARREQREFLASLDEEPTQRAGEDLGFHD